MTLLGAVAYERLLWKCEACRREHAPLDLGLGMQGVMSAGAAESALLLLAEMPHRRAKDLLARLCRVSVSAATVDRLADKVGPKARAVREAEQARMLEPVSPERPAPPCAEQPSELITREADGVMVRFQDQWHEVKTGVSFGLGPQGSDGGRARTVEPSYCATRADAAELGRQLQALSLGQGLRTAKASQFLSDGGAWMEGLAKDPLRWSEWTLDFFHASEHVAAATAAIYGQGTVRAAKAHKDLKAVLLEKGGNAAVRRSLEARERRARLGPESARIVDNTVKYLARFEEHTDYARLRALGWPIGSGAIESACKLYIKARFAGPGMRWSEEGFANIEAIRRPAYNNRHDWLRALLFNHSQN